MTLAPGYKQVKSFGPDEDYLDEEEVSYLTLDLGGVVEPTLLPSTPTYRLIGLDTPTPFLQLSGSIFKGRHDTLLGTELLFTEEKNDVHPNKRSLIHLASTNQRISFREVQLKEKARSESSLGKEDEVRSVYVDMETDKTATRVSLSDQPEQSRSQSATNSVPLRKKKKSRKGKERADVNEDTMDVT